MVVVVVTVVVVVKSKGILITQNGLKSLQVKDL